MSSERIQGELTEKVIKIKRCAAVVKGGRRFSFAALVVVGNGRGRVGWGYGKANEVPPSVEKARKEGMRSMVSIPLEGSTIPHKVEGFYGSAHVVLVPAAPGMQTVGRTAGQNTEWVNADVLKALRGELPVHIFNQEAIPRWLERFGGKPVAEAPKVAP